MGYIDPDVWMSLKQAATKWGCHYMTVYRNWSRIPSDERVRVGQHYYIWRHTKFRPNSRSGRPVTTYKGRTNDPKVRQAIPKLPRDLRTCSESEKEVWLALIDRVLEKP